MLALAGGLVPTGSKQSAVSSKQFGSMAPAGSLNKAVAKVLGGGLTPSSVITTARTVARTLAGALTPAGTMQRLTLKRTGGSVTPAAGIARGIGRRLAGVLGFFGVGSFAGAYVTKRADVEVWDASVTPMAVFDMSATVLTVADFTDRKSTRLNSSHTDISRMPSSA